MSTLTAPPQTVTLPRLSTHGLMQTALHRWPLWLACLFSLALALPTIQPRIADPNLIVYQNADEGGMMDLMWSYYSGERRDSFQWDVDYGLEMVWLSGLARVVLAPAMTVTPVTLAVLLRWLHLAAWLAALGLMWRLVGRHVGRGYPQAVAVALLAVRPAFVHLTTYWQPEPVVLALLLLGLDEALTHAERPAWWHIVAAVACASLAFLVKYAGLFLLPAVAASLVLAARRTPGGPGAVPRVRGAWLVYALVGAVMVGCTLTALAHYVRHATGRTWLQEYGWWGSLTVNPAAMAVCVAGAGLMGLSLLCWLVNRIREQQLWNTINSALMMVGGLFAAWTLLFGCWWLGHPERWLSAYSQMAPAALSTREAFLQRLAGRVQAFDPLLVLLAAIVGGVAMTARGRRVMSETMAHDKRRVLLWFVVPFIAVMVAPVRVERHHMLPFVAAAVVWILSSLRGLRSLRFLAVAVLVLDLLLNAAIVVRERSYQARQGDDIAFALAGWWAGHIPRSATVVADHYRRVYVPSGHPKLKVFRGSEHLDSWVEQLRDAVSRYHPDYVYYNAAPVAGAIVPPIEELLPRTSVELVRQFSSEGRGYRRLEGDRFLIYRILR
ncbi:MAG: hypothetical protein HY597_01015 [Candidatus Omnitrophica bacterium]|nr:hypothetical protein [Candidatus Omnitrophota bacterium]